MLFLITTSTSFGQNSTEKDSIIYPYCNTSKSEISAKFPGGYKALQKFLAKNLRWPNEDWCGEGKAYVRLTIDPTGKIKDSEIIRQIPGDDFLRNEVLRVMKLMPKWIPAYQLSTRKKVTSRIIVFANFRTH